MVNIKVRHYQSKDAQALASIYYNTIHKVCSKDYSPEQVNAWAPRSSLDIDGWVKKWQKLSPLVAVLNEKIVGFVELEPSGHIDCFYVHHDYLGKGIGSTLLVEVERAAAKKAKAIDRLYVEASITAKPFFEAKGFKIVKEQIITIRSVQLKNYKMEKYFI